MIHAEVVENRSTGVLSMAQNREQQILSFNRGVPELFGVLTGEMQGLLLSSV